MAGSRASQRTVRTVRLDDAGIEQILDSLDEAPQDATPRTDARRAERHRYRTSGVVVHMRQPGLGGTVPYLVPTHEISEVGLSFLHGGFVHTGTRCLVQLITSRGRHNNVTGTVVLCRHVKSGVHEVEVDFDQQVAPTEYCAELGRPRVLLAEDNPITSRLTIFHLQRLDAEVDHAENGRIAVNRALEKPYDLIIMDIEMPVLDGLAAVEELRSKGYTGMIAAATALTHDEDRVNCLKAGCDRYLAKPFAPSVLEDLLHLLREEPLFSSLSDDAALAELVEKFAAELPSRIRELEIAAAENDVTVLLGLVRTLKGHGGSYGFAIITEQAARIEDALLKGVSIAEVRENLTLLERLCTQAWSSLHGTHRHMSAP